MSPCHPHELAAGATAKPRAFCSGLSFPTPQRYLSTSVSRTRPVQTFHQQRYSCGLWEIRSSSSSPDFQPARSMLLEEEVQACHLTREHENAITRGWASRDNKYSHSCKTTVRYNGKTPPAATAGPEKSSFFPERVRRQAGTACQGFGCAVRSGEARGAAASWQRGRPGAVRRQRARGSANSARRRRLRPGAATRSRHRGAALRPRHPTQRAGRRPPPPLPFSLPFSPQPGRAVSPPRPSPAAPHVGEPRRSLLARRGRAAEAGREPPPPLLLSSPPPRLHGCRWR